MTYVYETLNTGQIARALKEDQYAGWSYNGAQALAEYLESLAADIGEPIELDIVSIRGEYSEYADLEALQSDYPDIKDMDDLENKTQVIEFDGGLIIAQF